MRVVVARKKRPLLNRCGNVSSRCHPDLHPDLLGERSTDQTWL